jgi:ribosome-associated toxin RatA of RatAB toxin-antitoxin module
MLEGTRTEELAVPAAAAWAVLADVAAYPSWQRLVDHVDVRARDHAGRPAVVGTALDAGIKVIGLELRYAYEPERAVRFDLVRGDVKALRGAWTLEPAGAAACRVTYAVEVDPGRRLGLLLRGGVADRVRAKVVDGAADDLRTRLGG